MLGTLEKVGITVCVVFVVLTAISFILPAMDIMYNPLYGTDPDIIGYSSPSARHLLGTDFMGRDVFSQLCSGAFHAFIHGLAWSIVGIPILVIVAFILAQLRLQTPRLEDTMLLRYIRFVAFPLGVTGLCVIFTFLLSSALGRLAWANTLFFAPLIAFTGWLAVGHELEVRFRKGEKIPLKLIFSGVFLILSYAALYDGIVGYMGISDPVETTWGVMIHWCFASGYTFRALTTWLLPPIICMYVFSRGMLALSYGMYNTVSEKYFWKEGWF